MTEQRATIAIADPLPVVAEGVRAILGTTTDFDFVEAVTSLDAVRELLKRTSPSILLLDKSFGQQSVSAFLAETKASGHVTAIIVWGTSGGGAEAARLLRAGATAVLSKAVSPAHLISCLRSAAAGGMYLDCSLLQGISPGPIDGLLTKRELTKREQEVLELAAEGYTNLDIALALGIWPGTVKVHLKHLIRKTGSHSRYELLGFSLREKAMRENTKTVQMRAEIPAEYV